MRRCMHHDWPLDEKQGLLLYQSGAATVLVLEATKLWAGHSRISRAEVTSIMQCICFPAGDSPYLESVHTDAVSLTSWTAVATAKHRVIGLYNPPVCGRSTMVTTSHGSCRFIWPTPGSHFERPHNCDFQAKEKS